MRDQCGILLPINAVTGEIGSVPFGVRSLSPCIATDVGNVLPLTVMANEKMALLPNWGSEECRRYNFGTDLIWHGNRNVLEFRATSGRLQFVLIRKDQGMACVYDCGFGYHKGRLFLLSALFKAVPVYRLSNGPVLGIIETAWTYELKAALQRAVRPGGALSECDWPLQLEAIPDAECPIAFLPPNQAWMKSYFLCRGYGEAVAASGDSVAVRKGAIKAAGEYPQLAAGDLVEFQGRRPLERPLRYVRDTNDELLGVRRIRWCV